MGSLLQKAEVFFEKHERHLSSFALIAGFIFDSLTLRRIDLLFENLTVLTYLVICGISIVLFNYFEAFPSERNFLIKFKNLLPLSIQFTFGGLFSAFFIFYSRSAALSASWPFILILLALLVGNEFFRSHYERLTFQVSIYFLALFSFSIFFLPVMFKKMGVGMFLLSGFLSLFIIYLFAKILRKVVFDRYRASRRTMRQSVVAIFILLNVLYFTNLIPPIPLSLKEAGVFQQITRSGESYLALGERETFLDKLLFFRPEKVHLKRGATLYAFSSVFAPTDLGTKIVHDWQYYDETTNEWVSATRITFSIRGGRDGGYRGFSEKENLFSGSWRVDIKTERGQIIGRIRFDVITTQATPPLILHPF